MLTFSTVEKKMRMGWLVRRRRRRSGRGRASWRASGWAWGSGTGGRRWSGEDGGRHGEQGGSAFHGRRAAVHINSIQQGGQVFTTRFFAFFIKQSLLKIRKAFVDLELRREEGLTYILNWN